MERNLAEQDKEIRELVRRADKNLDRTGTVRRDTLIKLIDLTHSRHPSLKRFAAGNIKLFFKDFPDLEEDAINAIYDLCEDPLSLVRLEGYTAIVQVSREQKKWVKRNADVLVQLLQSDEPEEVTVVKRALLEHLDMDPPATIGVLCDQVIPAQESLDDEELAIRNRLRSLVVQFLTGEAKRAILRHASRLGGEAESVLVTQILLAFPVLNEIEIEKIVKDLLMSLPSFGPLSQRGHETLQALMQRTKLSLTEDTQFKTHGLRNSRFFFDISSFLAVVKRVSSPAELLQFHCQYLETVSLSTFSEDDGLYLIVLLTDAITALEDERQRHRDMIPGALISSVRGQITSITPSILTFLCESRLGSAKTWQACEVILENAHRSVTEANWKIPGLMIQTLHNIVNLGAKQAKDINEPRLLESVQTLARSLLPKPAAKAPARPSPLEQDASGMKGNIVLPHSPSDVPPPSFSRRSTPNLTHTDTRPGPSSAGPSNGATQNSIVTGLGSNSTKRHHSTDDSPQSQKKIRMSKAGTSDHPPSLLSRLAVTNGSAASSPEVKVPIRRTDQRRPPARHDSMDTDERQSVGFSIKGAASRTQEASPAPLSRSSSSSLLDRMKSVDLSTRVDKGQPRRRRGGRA